MPSYFEGTSSHFLTLSNVRALASGWHFSKEALTDGEREMLVVIEELLNEVDSFSENGFAHVWPSEKEE